MVESEIARAEAIVRAQEQSSEREKERAEAIVRERVEAIAREREIVKAIVKREQKQSSERAIVRERERVRSNRQEQSPYRLTRLHV